MFSPGDKLLYAISYRRIADWPWFKSAFSAVECRDRDQQGGGVERYRALRVLDALGHIDVSSADNISIFATPSVLANLPSPGLPRGILCGSRAPQTIEDLREVARSASVEIEAIGQSWEPFAPSCIEVTAESNAVLGRFANAIGIRYEPIPAAWALAAVSPSLDDYLASREWVHGPELNWPKWDFDPDRVRFVSLPKERASFRLTKYLSPITGVPTFRLWQDGMQASADLDWSRYVVLRHEGRPTISFGPSAVDVAIPAGAPLPRLLARALALCSGKAPMRVYRRDLSDSPVPADLYGGVPDDLMEHVMELLGQSGQRAGSV